MALTVFPTCVFNAGTGSDTAASGAGPGTAVTGTAAAHTNGSSSTTITFTNSPDLSGVAQDGSHVLWLDTSSGRQFSRISTVDNGAKTCVVEDSFNIAAGSPVNYAIGGTRATFDNADSRTLFGSAGAKAGWTIEYQDAQSLSSAITNAMAGDALSNHITIVATGGSESARTITQTANAAHFTTTGSMQLWRNCSFHNSNGTKTAADAFDCATNTILLVFEGCVLGDRANTNTLRSGLRRSSGSPGLTLTDCEVAYCTDDGIRVDGTTTISLRIQGSRVHHCGGNGIHFLGAAGGALFCIVTETLLDHNTGDGYLCSGTAFNAANNLIACCTLDANGADGIDLSGAALSGLSTLLHSCQLTNNGGYGVRGHSTINGVKNYADYNNYFGNTTGARLNLTAGAHDQAVDPGYVDAANGDYRIGTATKALGFPDATRNIGANPTTGTKSYVDIGAAQRQERFGDGTGAFRHMLKIG